MTAPCPALGFIVVIEPIAGLGEAERETFRRAWRALLDERGLHASDRIGLGRSAVIVTSEASQATQNDREAARSWLASRAELRHASVSDLEDLGDEARGELERLVSDRDRTPRLETGNVVDAGAATRGWFVGDLAGWAASRGERLDPSSTPRQSDDVYVKWVVHPPGHERPIWADPDLHFALGILIDGDMHIDFRALDGAEESIRLTRRGDYAIWHGPSYAHTWRSERGCTFLTVRWPA